MMNDLNELRALDARNTIKDKLEAEKLKLQNRETTRQVEANRARAPKWLPGTPTRLPQQADPDQDLINSFWKNATRLGQIMARGESGTGTLGGAQIMGHVGPTIGSAGDAERAQAVQQPGMATWQADDIRRKAMAGIRGARG